MGWGNAVWESVTRVGKTGWKILGSLIEGNLPSNYVSSNYEPLFSEEITIDYLIP